MKFSGFGLRWLAVLFAGGLLAGCQTDPGPQFNTDPLAENATLTGSAAGQPQVDPVTGAPILHPGDTVTVTFQDLVNPIQPVDVLIKEDGTITLNYNKVFHAAGKTAAQLERDIRQVYVPEIYVNMTPTVIIKDRFFTVGGEVKQPGRQVYVGHMTVTRAIDAAGGFTDFARKHKVLLTRANGTKAYVDTVKALEHPELDLEVFAGDQVFVGKRLW